MVPESLRELELPADTPGPWNNLFHLPGAAASEEQHEDREDDSERSDGQQEREDDPRRRDEQRGCPTDVVEVDVVRRPAPW